jgi:DNA-binding IclR family transcriptional regulator
VSDDGLDGLPSDISELLATAIETIEKLEILLHTARLADRWLTVTDLAQATGLGRGDAALAAQGLIADQLLARAGERVRFAPRPVSRGATVAALERKYLADRSHVVALMCELARERVGKKAAAAVHRRTRKTRASSQNDG